MAWVAVAAAAMFLVVRVGMPGMGSSKQEAAYDKAAAPKATTGSPGAQANEVARTPSDSERRSGDQTAPLAVPAAPAPVAQTQKSMASGETNSYKVAAADGAVVPMVELTLPGSSQMGIAEAPASKMAQPPREALTAVAAASNVAVSSAGADGGVVALSHSTVENQAPDGATLWSRPVEQTGAPANMAVAPNGYVALASGSRLQILNSRGEQERLLSGTAPIDRLQWSADGWVASREGTQVFVYGPAGDKPEFSVEAGTGADMAFGPDGTLAVYGDRPDAPGHLMLTDRKGTVLMEARTGTGGHGVVWSGDGSAVVAAGHGYNRAGKELWQLPIVTDGVAALGPSLIIAWDARTVLVVDAVDGHAVWQAVWNGPGNGIRRVVAAPDGKHLAVSAAVDGSGAVWVLDAAGSVVFTDRTGEQPVDLALSGSHLVLMLPDSVSVRQLPE
jgi:hypothetical protein